MKTNRIWLTVIALILLVASLTAFWVNQQESNSRIADIYQHGKIIKSIDLAKVDKPYRFRLKDGHGGWNEILVRPGEIEIAEANCPDQLCVHQGSISTGVEPIVCLPHELVIRIRGEDGEPIDSLKHIHQHEHDSSTTQKPPQDDVDIVVK